MDLQEIDFGNKNIYHLCLYKGVDVVAAACVESDYSKQQAYIKRIVCPKPEHQDVLLNKIYQDNNRLKQQFEKFSTFVPRGTKLKKHFNKATNSTFFVLF